MSDINNERLAKFEGLHYHKWRPVKIYPYLICSLCGVYHSEPNPDYSTSPDDRERLWGYLMRKEEMWKAFKTAILTAKIGEPYDTDLIVYLFSFIDGVPRWVGLLSDWLGNEGSEGDGRRTIIRRTKLTFTRLCFYFLLAFGCLELLLYIILCW